MHSSICSSNPQLNGSNATEKKIFLSEEHLKEIFESYFRDPNSIEIHKKDHNEIEIFVEIENKTIPFNLTQILKSIPNLSSVTLTDENLTNYVRMLSGHEKVELEFCIKKIFKENVKLPNGLTLAQDKEYPSWHIAHKLAVFIWTLNNFDVFDINSPLNLSLQTKIRDRKSLGVKEVIPGPYTEIQHLLRKGKLCEKRIYNEPKIKEIIICLLLTACTLSHAIRLGLKDKCAFPQKQNNNELETTLYRFESAYGDNYGEMLQNSYQKKNDIELFGFSSFSKRLDPESSHLYLSSTKHGYLLKTQIKNGTDISRGIPIDNFSYKREEFEILFQHVSISINNISKEINDVVQPHIDNNVIKEYNLTLLEIDIVPNIKALEKNNKNKEYEDWFLRLQNEEEKLNKEAKLNKEERLNHKESNENKKLSIINPNFETEKELSIISFLNNGLNSNLPFNPQSFNKNFLNLSLTKTTEEIKGIGTALEGTQGKPSDNPESHNNNKIPYVKEFGFFYKKDYKSHQTPITKIKTPSTKINKEPSNLPYHLNEESSTESYHLNEEPSSDSYQLYEKFVSQQPHPLQQDLSSKSHQQPEKLLSKPHQRDDEKKSKYFPGEHLKKKVKSEEPLIESTQMKSVAPESSQTNTLQ